MPMLLPTIYRLPGPIQRWAIIMIQKGPTYSWMFIFLGFAMGAMLSFGIWTAPYELDIWSSFWTWTTIFLIPWFIAGSVLCAYGKIYEGKLSLPPLDEKYKLQTNQIFLIFGLMGFFKLVLFLLGWD